MFCQQEHRRVGANARLFFKSEKGNNWVISKSRVMWPCIDMRTIPRILSYEVRLKFFDDDADADDNTEDAKAITITRLFFFEKQRAKDI